MKKVLFTATVDSHILQFHIPFLKLFKENGYEVHVATNGNETIPYCDVKHVVSFERSPIKINNLKAIKQLRKIINKEKFDMIHCHTPMGSVVTRIAAKKARKNGTRVIYTAHGFHFYKGAPILNWIVFYPVEKWLAKYTDTLITINKEDYDLAKKKFSKRCKDIEYVPGVGIDENKFDFEMTEEEKQKLRESLGIKNDDFVMIYPARLDKNKNQGLLIDAVKKLSREFPNIQLLLPGNDELNGYYQNMAKERDVESKIHFLGYRKDIQRLIKISNLAVSSSLREGLPVNIMEAMCAGLPIVATDCRGNRDFIKNNINGYVVNANRKDEMVFYIKKIYLSKEKSNRMGEENRNLIKDYLLKEIIDKMGKIYFRKKKVLHILASNKYSGAENVACTIINKLSNDYDMYYCSPYGTIEKVLEDRNIKYIPIKNLTYSEIKNVINVVKPDIIHAHDNKATVITSFFHDKCKVVSHIHGNNRIMNTINLKTLLFDFCSRNINQIIWVSDSSYNDYIFKKHVCDKSIILYNVIDKEQILNKSEMFDCKANYDLIFLGRLAYPKNPERLIEIINLVKKQKKDISLAIVGDGEERAKIEKMIDDYKLNENITLFGFQDNPYPILKQSKILIMTSIYEGTPMAALEAQAMGKPIIGTPVDGIKKIVKNEYNGFLSNDNTKISEAIINYTESDEYKNIANNVKRCFDKFNNLTKYIKSINDIYESNN